MRINIVLDAFHEMLIFDVQVFTVFVISVAAIISASVVGSEIVECFLDEYDTRLSPRNIKYHVVDFLS